MWRNLEWCTIAYNTNYGTARQRSIETRKSKPKKTKKKPKRVREVKETNSIKQKVYCVELDREFNSITEASRELGICRSAISECCSGKLKSSGRHPITGERLHWKYVD